jgi:formate hydrogenlyase subunit 3/multisubunit Na+/H+ antiporter MnhD subunit
MTNHQVLIYLIINLLFCYCAYREYLLIQNLLIQNLFWKQTITIHRSPRQYILLGSSIFNDWNSLLIVTVFFLSWLMHLIHNQFLVYLLILSIIPIVYLTCLTCSKRKMELVLGLIILISFVLFLSSYRWVWLLVMFESVTLPLIIIVIIWGYNIEKIVRVYVLSIYVIISGILLLVCLIRDNNELIIYLHNQSVVTSILTFLLSLSFLIKLPIYILHRWLPIVHVESSTLGSVLLSSLLLKLNIKCICRDGNN